MQGKKYSDSFKAKVLALADKTTVQQAADKFKVHFTNVYQWRKAAKESSNGQPVGPLAACSSLTDAPPEPGPMDERLRVARDKYFSAKTNDEQVEVASDVISVVMEREIAYLKTMLSLRNQEIALLREQLAEGKA